jgi:serine protease Do
MLVPGAALADQPSVAPVELVPESDSPAPPAPAPVAPRLPPQQGQRVPVPRAPARRPAPPPLPAAAQPAALPPADAQAAPPPAEKSNEPPVEERAQRGVVVVERAGQPVSLGVVLAGDGRILCALSPLASGNDLEAHYADGSVARVKLGHHDRVWDLALLVPQTGRWNEGLSASMRDPVRPDASIHAFTLSRGKPAPVNMVIRGRRNLLGADDASLPNALELGSRVTPLDLGSPIIDEEGRVVGVLARGCAPADKGPCTPVAFGVPNNAIRNFLRNVPASAAPPAAWLGIQGVSESGAFAKGVRILVVHPDSPAEEAKLKGGDESVGDTILAVDGVPVTTPEALAEAIRTHAVGEKVPLTVFGQGKYRQVTVALRTAPDPRAAPKAQPAHQAELPPLADAPSPAPGPRPRAQQR